jgi:hypothetical protein
MYPEETKTKKKQKKKPKKRRLQNIPQISDTLFSMPKIFSPNVVGKETAQTINPMYPLP